MSHLPYTFGNLPPNPPPLNLLSLSPNYLLLYSFQKNWTHHSLIHISCYCPLFNLIAGDHYFKWRVSGNPNPVCSLLLVCSPSIALSHPIVYSTPSTHFKGISGFIFCNLPPDDLPLHLEESILEVGADTNTNISPLVDILNSFLDNFHRPISPPSIPLPLHSSPLGPYQ